MVKLVYTCAPGEGPERKNLLKHNMHVTPDEPWECKNLEFARMLVQEYPQIDGADAASKAALAPPKTEPAAPAPAPQKEVKAGE